MARQFGKVDIALYLNSYKYLKMQLVVFYASNSLMILMIHAKDDVCLRLTNICLVYSNKATHCLDIGHCSFVFHCEYFSFFTFKL